MPLPEKTVERLSAYRRSLLNCLENGKTHIYSHELAALHNVTAVQVRRDIMFVGYTSTQKKGYDINELVAVIGQILDSRFSQNVGVIGMGNLGRAITGYFLGKRPKLKIVAAFDVDPSKIGKEISGIHCYSFYEIESLIKQLQINIALLTVPPEHAAEASKKLVQANIKGILNFTSVPINPGPNVYVEEYDMITSIEKVAYYVKNPRE